MAKKKVSLKDKLGSERINRNKVKEQAPLLTTKKPLKSSAKNVKSIEDQVAKIHQEEATKPIAPKVEPKEPTTRLTVDVSKSMHKQIKIKVAEMETKIQWYLFNLIKDDLEK